MPRKKSYYQRKKRRHRQLPIIHKSVIGNRAYRCNLMYSDLITINSNIAGIAYTFRANSLYDPDLTATGHQPLGFDQIMPLFTHYCVIRVKYDITFLQVTTSSTLSPCVVGVEASTNPTPDYTPYTALEQVNSKFKLMTIGQSSRAQQRFKGTINIGALNAIKDVTQDDSYKGTSTSSPTELDYLHLIQMPWNALYDPDSVLVLVKLMYDVLFTEPITPAQS